MGVMLLLGLALEDLELGFLVTWHELPLGVILTGLLTDLVAFGSLDFG